MSPNLDDEADPTFEIDLTGVHPSRRDEMRRRAAAAMEWLSTRAAGPNDEADAAARLGLGIQAFRNLVRAWTDHGEARMLPGARIATRRPNRLKPSFSREAEAIVADVIADLGTDARRRDVVDETMRRCEAAKVGAPGESSIAARLYRARSEKAPIEGLARLVVDHCAVRLPVLHDGLVRAPVATIVFDRSRRIFAFDLRIGGPVPQTAARVVADALGTPPADEERVPLRLNVDFTPGWKEVLAALDRAFVVREGSAAAPVPSARDTRRMFGAAIGNVALLPLATHSSSQVASLARLKSPPLTLEEARGALGDAIVLHNRSVSPAAGRPRIASDPRESGLLRELERLAGGLTEAPRVRRRR